MIKRAVVLVLIVATGVALYLFADLESMSSAILSMAGEALLLMLALLIINEIIKGLRWAFLLRASGLDISYVDGLTSYLAAQAATAVPGGSWLSARLAEEHGHIRTHQAASGFVGQAVADIWAISLLAVIGIELTGQRHTQLAIPLVATLAGALGVVVVRSPRLRHSVTALVNRWRLTRRFLSIQEGFLEHSARLMRARTLGIVMVFSFASTFLSAMILLIIAGALTDRGLSPSEALYSHTISIIARMAVPVPGGYGVSDASLTGMLNYVGIGLARATFIALAVRSVGIIFRTCLGIFMLIVRYPYLLIGPLDAPKTQPHPVGVRRFASRAFLRRPLVAVLKHTSFVREGEGVEQPRPQTHPQPAKVIPAIRPLSGEPAKADAHAHAHASGPSAGNG